MYFYRFLFFICLLGFTGKQLCEAYKLLAKHGIEYSLSDDTNNEEEKEENSKIDGLFFRSWAISELASETTINDVLFPNKKSFYKSTLLLLFSPPPESPQA